MTDSDFLRWFAETGHKWRGWPQWIDGRFKSRLQYCIFGTDDHQAKEANAVPRMMQANLDCAGWTNFSHNVIHPWRDTCDSTPKCIPIKDAALDSAYWQVQFEGSPALWSDLGDLLSNHEAACIIRDFLMFQADNNGWKAMHREDMNAELVAAVEAKMKETSCGQLQAESKCPAKDIKRQLTEAQAGHVVANRLIVERTERAEKAEAELAALGGLVAKKDEAIEDAFASWENRENPTEKQIARWKAALALTPELGREQGATDDAKAKILCLIEDLENRTSLALEAEEMHLKATVRTLREILDGLDAKEAAVKEAKP